MIKKPDTIPITREEVLEWIRSGSIKKEKIEPKPELYKCPKADICIMDCYHKKPHKYEEQFCNDLDGTGNCGVKCVHELWSDVTFFKEDFQID